MARIELALHAPKARVMPLHYTEKKLVLCPGIEPGSDAYKAPASPLMLTELIWWRW